MAKSIIPPILGDHGLSIEIGAEPPEGYIWTAYQTDNGVVPICAKRAWVDRLNRVSAE